MNDPHPSLATILPVPMPSGETEQRLLFAIRRMAVHGIADAEAAYTLMLWLGTGFRRPLLLVRALMVELSQVAARVITVAPCCCPRMTRDEAALIVALGDALDDPVGAHRRLAAALNIDACAGVVLTLQAIAQACQDNGVPLVPQHRLHIVQPG